MPLTPEEFHARAMAAADPDGRLPVPDGVTGWEIFPFDKASLTAVPLAGPADEPARRGTDPADCPSCVRRDVGVWRDPHWRIERVPGVGIPLLLMLSPLAHHDLADLPDDRAAELGRLTVHVARATEALPHVGRAHVSRWGDGGAHLHVFFWARPARLTQLRGSCLPLWDDLLPEYPADVADADAATVASALAGSYGGTAAG